MYLGVIGILKKGALLLYLLVVLCTCRGVCIESLCCAEEKKSKAEAELAV